VAEKEDPRQKIARETLTPFEKSVPEFGETSSLLDLLNSFPEMYVGGTNGALGTYKPFKNQLAIAPQAFYNNHAQETALHELTHALNENMSRSYFNMDPKYRRDFKSATDEELNFTDAYNKLRPAQSALIDNKGTTVEYVASMLEIPTKDLQEIINKSDEKIPKRLVKKFTALVQKKWTNGKLNSGSLKPFDQKEYMKNRSKMLKEAANPKPSEAPAKEVTAPEMPKEAAPEETKEPTSEKRVEVAEIVQSGPSSDVDREKVASTSCTIRKLEDGTTNVYFNIVAMPTHLPLRVHADISLADLTASVKL